GVEGLQRLRDTAVEQPPTRKEKLTVHDLADPVVRELEVLAATVQDSMANQLLHAQRGLGFADVRRALEQREVERAPDHGRDGHQLAALGAEPPDPIRDELADALGKREPRGALRDGAASEGAQGLDD